VESFVGFQFFESGRGEKEQKQGMSPKEKLWNDDKSIL
jgi:hypothetical protein